MSWLLSPYRDPRTYKAIAYLLIGLPLGVAEFVIVVTGLALGLGLSVTLLGIPVLVAMLLVTRSLASFERQLSISLLDAAMPRVRRPPLESAGFWWRSLKELLSRRRTWGETGYLIARLPLGTADFIVVVTIISLATSAIVQPILVTAGVHTQFGSWVVDTYEEALFFVPVSIVYLLVGPRLIVAWSSISRRFSTAMLGAVEPGEMKKAVSEILTRTGRADAFTILDELGVLIGRGPFLTPTRVEATLIALEAAGRVRASRDESRAEWTLV